MHQNGRPPWRKQVCQGSDVLGRSEVSSVLKQTSAPCSRAHGRTLAMRKWRAGKGLDYDQRRKIWDHFEQEEKSRSEVNEKTSESSATPPAAKSTGYTGKA